MRAAGWRKRGGDIFTLDLGDGFHAWLGLNKSTRADSDGMSGPTSTV